MNKPWVVAGALTVAALIGIPVGLSLSSTTPTGPTPATAYAVNCVTPGNVAYSGTADAVNAWVATPPQSGQCWITIYQPPWNATTTSTTLIIHVPSTTTTKPPFNWTVWCAAHPTYYNPSVCPTHIKPVPPTTIPKGTT